MLVPHFCPSRAFSECSALHDGLKKIDPTLLFVNLESRVAFSRGM